MQRNWKALALSGAMLLSLCACAAGDVANDVISDMPSAAPSWNIAPTPVPPPEPTPTPFWTEGEKALFFHTLPWQFSFLSGAGGWSTDLYLTTDESYVGSFTGQYHDGDMGDVGEDYPNGTVYYCNFTGKFTQPERLEEYSYSVKLEELTCEEPPETESIGDDGVRYITTGPYGLENVGELRIYFPGYPIKNIPEADRFWLLSAPELAVYTLEEMGEQVVPENTWLIHNVNEGQLFFGSFPEMFLYDDVSGLVEPS